MIGDWVLIYGNPTKIDNLCVINEITEPTLITRSYIRIDVENPDTGVYNDHLVIQSEIALKKVHPIPLTDEILEKNFTGTDEVGWNADGEGYWITEAPLETKPQVNIKLHYVHELQHALRLCGINEDIQL